MLMNRALAAATSLAVLLGAAEASCSGNNNCDRCIGQTDWSGDTCAYCVSSGLCSASIATSCSSLTYY